MALILSGCVGSGVKLESIPLSAIPSDIVACFNKLVPRPGPGPMTKARIVGLIADLKKSEEAKSVCGKRLIAFYYAHA